MLSMSCLIFFIDLVKRKRFVFFFVCLFVSARKMTDKGEEKKSSLTPVGKKLTGRNDNGGNNSNICHFNLPE